MFYFVKTPSWLRKLFPGRVWDVRDRPNSVYLSFDDGPHPEHTAFVLDELKKYNAKATFFCIGKNVLLYPEMYRRILDEGHSTANHTQNHLKGKKTSDSIYINDVLEAEKYIDSSLFRPPYGRATNFQVKLLKEKQRPMKIIMWSVLSGDFDTAISAGRCKENVLLNAKGGSIIVFHDSEKAAERLRGALPAVLQSLHEKGFSFEKLDPAIL